MVACQYERSLWFVPAGNLDDTMTPFRELPNDEKNP